MSNRKKIFYNGTVYAGNGEFLKAFSVEDGKIAEVWKDEPETDGTDADLIDLSGSFVCAGFNDSHMHLLNFGKVLDGADLSAHTGSLKDLKDSLRKHLSEKGPGAGGWLLGRGWNQDYFSDTDRMPDRHDLDEVSDQVPIMITRTCGHCCVLNSPAIETAGITADSKDPDGGRIGKNGEVPDGRLYENAVRIPAEVIPVPSLGDIKSLIKNAAGKANSYGVTSVQTDDYGVFAGLDPLTVNEAYRELIDSGELTVRVHEQCNLGGADALKDFIARGGMACKQDDFFSSGTVKILGDGSLGSRTARLSVEYPGTDEKGILIFRMMR